MAPMLSVHGSDHVKPVFDLAVPSSFTNQMMKLPSIEQAISKPWFFGHLPSSVHVTWEPDCLGSSRLVFKGTCRFLIASSVALFKSLDEATQKKVDENPQGKALVVEAIKNVLRNCVTTELAAALFSKGVAVFHGDVHEKQLIIILAGYLVCITPADTNSVGGLRRSFLLKAPKTLPEVEFLRDLLPSQPLLSSAVELLSLGVVRPPA